MKNNHHPFSASTYSIIQTTIDAIDVPKPLIAFYDLVSSQRWSKDFKEIAEATMKKLKTYDKILSLNDYSAIEIEYACKSFDLDKYDYGMLIACYGEVDWLNRCYYDRNVLYDMLEKTSFYDNAILDGSIDFVLNYLKSVAFQRYRIAWYETMVNVIQKNMTG